MKTIQHHSYDAVGEDKSDAENVDGVEDAPVILDGPSLNSCTEVFLIDTFQTTYEWKDLLQLYFVSYYIILNRSCVVDEYLYLLVFKSH